MQRLIMLYFISHLIISKDLNHMTVLCTSSTEDTLKHLFLYCPFAQACFYICKFQSIVHPYAILDALKSQLHVPFFMENIILLRWSIWTRNNLIFQNWTRPLIQVMNAMAPQGNTTSPCYMDSGDSLHLVSDSGNLSAPQPIPSSGVAWVMVLAYLLLRLVLPQFLLPLDYFF